jgi:hypothetical protein
VRRALCVSSYKECGTLLNLSSTGWIEYLREQSENESIPFWMIFIQVTNELELFQQGHLVSVQEMQPHSMEVFYSQ